MEVLKSGEAEESSFVTNLEVMHLLQERMAARQSPQENSNGNDIMDTEKKNTISKGVFQNRDWIESTVLDNLQSSPVGESNVKIEDMPKLVATLRSNYELTTAETLQVLNHLPTSLVEVHLLIEDIEKREKLGTTEQQLEFLQTISQFSGRQVEESNENEED